MAFKFTLVFNAITGAADDPAQQRSGGWSESVYDSVVNDQVMTDLRTLSQRRATLLPRSARIVTWRVQPVDPSGRAAPTSVSFPGPQNDVNDTDIPQMALQFTAPDTGGTHSRRMKIACIPDRFVIRGEFLPTPAYRRALTSYLDELSGWRMRSLDFTQVVQDIVTVNGGGVRLVHCWFGLVPEPPLPLS